MESSLYKEDDDFLAKNSINRYLSAISSSLLAGGIVYSMFYGKKSAEAWIFRDDIGAPNGVKGYEEQVNSVGEVHGKCYWPSEEWWSTYNSST